MKKTVLKLISLLILISLFTSVFSSCRRAVPNDLGSSEPTVAYKLKKEYGVPSFNTSLFATVEMCFESFYYTSLPSKDELAKKTYDTFVEYFKDAEFTSEAELTHALIDCYIFAVGDRYAHFRTEDETEDYTVDMSGSFVGIGVSVLRNDLEKTIIVQGTEPGSPAEAAGIKVDDYIVAVNGEYVSEIGTQAAVDKIRGEIGTEVNVTVLRNGEEITFSMLRQLITELTVRHEILADTNIGYIKISSFKANTAQAFKESLDAVLEAGATSVIFDLRSNPGGYLSTVCNMLSYLVPTGTKIVSFSSSRADIYAEHGTPYEETDHTLTVPSVILVNGASASASELFTGAMKDYNAMGLLSATVIGEKTFGKGIMQSEKRFTDGSTLTLTTALFNPPLGKNFHGEGVYPDITLDPNESDYIAEAIKYLIG